MNQKEIYITYKGETRTIREWSAIKGVSWTAIYQRIVRRGWSVTRAMETPFQSNTKPAKEIRANVEIIEFTDEHDEKEEGI